MITGQKITPVADVSYRLKTHLVFGNFDFFHEIPKEIPHVGIDDQLLKRNAFGVVDAPHTGDDIRIGCRADKLIGQEMNLF